MFKKLTLTSGLLVLSAFSLYSLRNIVTTVNAAAPCIITISGIQYDVAPLTVAGVHPGGNVFVCGTDMTALFMSMPTHAADIARMTPYIYVAPTVAPTATPTVMPTVTPTVTPTVSPTVTPTVTPTVSPTITPTVSPTVTPRVTPTISPSQCQDNDDVDEPNDKDGEHDNGRREKEDRGKSFEHRNNPTIKAGRSENREDK